MTIEASKSKEIPTCEFSVGQTFLYDKYYYLPENSGGVNIELKPGSEVTITEIDEPKENQSGEWYVLVHFDVKNEEEVQSTYMNSVNFSSRFAGKEKRTKNDLDIGLSSMYGDINALLN